MRKKAKAKLSKKQARKLNRPIHGRKRKYLHEPIKMWWEKWVNTDLAFMESPNSDVVDDYDKDKYQHDQEYHRTILLQTMSGRRLHKVTGKDLFDMIYWDNASPIPGSRTADLEHMGIVMRRLKPKCVLLRIIRRSTHPVKRPWTTHHILHASRSPRRTIVHELWMDSWWKYGNKNILRDWTVWSKESCNREQKINSET